MKREPSRPLLRPWLVPLALLALHGCVSRHFPEQLTSEPAVVRFDFTRDADVTDALQPSDAPYRLGVGDVLALSIYGEDGSLRELPVDPNGNITYLMIGSIPAAGRTLDELRAELQELVAVRLARGVAQVVPVRFGSQTFTVLGELNYPGTYLLEGRTTVLDAIARAQGIRTGYFRNSTAEMADFRNATLMRGGRVVPVDFEALMNTGDATQNVELRNGDILNIPSSLVRNVYVLGDVVFPRTVGFVSSLSLLQALAEARGLKSSSDGRIVVVRGTLARPEARVVMFESILSGEHPNLSLAPRDIVYVPPRRLTLMREIVETAISAFANTVSAGSASRLYQEQVGPRRDAGDE